jgi:hypothetical protein
MLELQSHGKSHQRLALKESVAHHLRLINEIRNKQTYYVNRHHFLLIGWEYSSQKTKCIDATTAKEWDKLLG